MKNGNANFGSNVCVFLCWLYPTVDGTEPHSVYNDSNYFRYLSGWVIGIYGFRRREMPLSYSSKNPGYAYTSWGCGLSLLSTTHKGGTLCS